MFILVLLFQKEYKALGLLLIFSLVIPLAEFMIALYNVQWVSKAFLYLIFIPLVAFLGGFYVPKEKN